MNGQEAQESLPDLQDISVHARLTQALPLVIRILAGWGLTRAQQGALLTLSPRTIQRVQASGSVRSVLNQDQLTRLSLIVGIGRALPALYGQSSPGWIQRINGRFPFLGRTPLTFMLDGGIPAMLAVRRLLEGDRGSQFATSSEAFRQAGVAQQVELDLGEY